MGGHGFLLSVSFPDTTSPKIGGQKDEAIDRRIPLVCCPTLYKS